MLLLQSNCHYPVKRLISGGVLTENSCAVFEFRPKLSSWGNGLKPLDIKWYVTLQVKDVSSCSCKVTIFDQVTWSDSDLIQKKSGVDVVGKQKEIKPRFRQRWNQEDERWKDFQGEGTREKGSSHAAGTLLLENELEQTVLCSKSPFCSPGRVHLC